MVNACQGLWTNKMIEYNSIFGFFIHSCNFHLIYYYEFHEPTYGHRILKESFSIPYLPLYLITLRKQRTKPEIYLLLPSLVFCGMGGDGECNLFSLFSHFQCYLVISMITPNGRFITQKKICLSMSDYHPESWNPMWSVSSILTGLLSFMMDESPTTGSVKTTVAEKQRLAKASLAFNCKNQNFRELFPEYVEKHTQQQQLMQQAELAVSSTSAGEEGTFLPNPNRSVAGSKDGNLQEEEAPKNTRKNKGPPFPTWLLLLLFSIFGVVMALPLLQS